MSTRKDFTEGMRVKNITNGLCGTVQKNFLPGVKIWMSSDDVPVIYDVEKGLAGGADVIQGVDCKELIKI